MFVLLIIEFVSCLIEESRVGMRRRGGAFLFCMMLKNGLDPFL